MIYCSTASTNYFANFKFYWFFFPIAQLAQIVLEKFRHNYGDSMRTNIEQCTRSKADLNTRFKYKW